MKHRSLWNDENVAMLSELWADGFTASQVALHLTRKFGCHVTRNAVIGKIQRLALPPRTSLPYVLGRTSGKYTRTPEQNAHRREQYAIEAHSPSLAPINGKARHMLPRLWKARHAPPVAYAGEPKLITELPNGKGCRYAVTETKPFRFCGAPGYPWCPNHHSIVYRPL